MKQQVPKAEDGNNFGVEVQKYVDAHLKESCKKWKETWDSIAGNCFVRATAVEKLDLKASFESSTTTTVTSFEGGKDRDEEKSVTGRVENQSHTGNSVS
uniref:Proteasome activator PA28 C-terminal domain-containing protein n=1 Tax=Peronospora matthiolae TaxID=2874970 RepID=A0AAV1U7P1_9STRA